MQHFVLGFLVVVLTTSLLNVTDAKRGCAAYGHSCFGGHGKRSGPVIEPDCTGDNRANNPACSPDAILRRFPNANQEIAYPTTNELGPNRNDIAQSIAEQRNMQFAVYNIIRQMVENARKARLSADYRTEINQI